MRKAIFERLVEGPLAVVDLADKVPVSRPAVSQHLRVLKEAGLVMAQPVGTRRIYRVDAGGLAVLRADLDRFWGRALANYKALVEESNRGEPDEHADRAHFDPPRDRRRGAP